MTNIFAGFRRQGHIHGCTYKVDSEQEFNKVNERFLKVFNSNDVASLRQIFESIEWKSFDPEEDTRKRRVFVVTVGKGC